MVKTMIYIKKDKAKINGDCPIYIKIYLDQSTTTLSTGRYITERRWKETNNLRQPLRLEKEKTIKEFLDLMVLKIEKLHNECEKFGETLNIEEFKLKLLNKIPGDTKPNIIEIITVHNEHFLNLVKIGERAPASFQKYERAKELVRLFNLKAYGTENVLIENINSAYIYNLESYLKFESVYKGNVGIRNNSVVKYMNNLKTIFNYGIKMELIEKNPFNLYTGKIKVKEAVFLTKEELERIENKTFKMERLERVKDIFLFCCYTGYAPVDVMKLTKENIIQDSDKTFWIKATRQKTGTRANVPLLPPALKIISKYQWNDSNRLLPKISNQKMNAYLKEIADVLGINKKLNWYVSRHTFATTVTLGNGIKIENVSAMLGHTTLKQTQHYAKVLDQNVKEDMKDLMKKFNQKD